MKVDSSSTSDSAEEGDNLETTYDNVDIVRNKSNNEVTRHYRRRPSSASDSYGVDGGNKNSRQPQRQQQRYPQFKNDQNGVLLSPTPSSITNNGNDGSRMCRRVSHIRRRCSVAAEHTAGYLMTDVANDHCFQLANDNLSHTTAAAVEPNIAGNLESSLTRCQQNHQTSQNPSGITGVFSGDDDFSLEQQRKSTTDLKLRSKVINHTNTTVTGEGSYSKVKECIDTKNLCRRSVKIMNFRNLRRIPNGEEIAKREVDVLKSIPKHENIVTLYSVYEDKLVKQKLYIFLDYAVCSLQELLDDYQRPFPAWQLHKYFVQLISGVEFLHCHHIVHNDLKPGNLLLTYDQVVKICDFGSAEILDKFEEQDHCQRCRGTPAFQAPEVAAGQDDYSATKLDIWSAGVCLYTLSIGELPFKAANVYLMFKAVENGHYEIPEFVDSSLRTLLNGMMCVNVHKRYTLHEIKSSEWYHKKHPLTLLDGIPTQSKAALSRGPCPMIPYLFEAYSAVTSDNRHQNASIAITGGGTFPTNNGTSAVGSSGKIFSGVSNRLPMLARSLGRRKGRIIQCNISSCQNSSTDWHDHPENLNLFKATSSVARLIHRHRCRQSNTFSSPKTTFNVSKDSFNTAMAAGDGITKDGTGHRRRKNSVCRVT
ncbi:hypothetical protein GJ496_010316 [Pomphorhynchus laevis]|nr:hypothetical protein GJ496_010316 [Pomphorhynchus laevis]